MARISRELIRWYRNVRRDLPWRRTRDPWRILVSEVMLQQTRVQAVIPYYERFFDRYPTAADFANASESEVLAVWAGLGYYSRARNLQKAAQAIVEAGGFPATHEAIRKLPGVGDYTAAAVSSIAFGEPRAAVDGNVLRVVARLTNDAGDIASPRTRVRFGQVAQSLLDGSDAGDFNQAMMELGATVCLPRNPSCLLCPLSGSCEGFAAGRQRELPVKTRPAKALHIERTLLLVQRDGDLLMWQQTDPSKRMAGFWELPEPEHLPKAKIVAEIGEFRHTITHHHYRFRIARATIPAPSSGFCWMDARARSAGPVSTIVRKALRVAGLE